MSPPVCYSQPRKLKRSTLPMAMMTPAELGTEHVRFDLSPIISGPDDPKIEEAFSAYVVAVTAFKQEYQGNLDTKLGPALDALIQISRIFGPHSNVFQLLGKVHATDTRIRKLLLALSEREAKIDADCFTFFSIELGKLSDEAVAAQSEHPTVQHHLPMIRRIRENARYFLPEAVEAALTRRKSIIESVTEDMMEEWLAGLLIDFPDGRKTLSEALEIISSSKSSIVRSGALRRVNAALEPFEPFAARFLSTSVALKRVSDEERGYAHPMASRNIGNKLPDAVVEALHQAILREAPALVARYYRLKARVLKLPSGIMHWSDRNAPLPFSDDTKIGFDQARKIVCSVFGSFSPTLLGIVEDIFSRNLIDAPATPGKQAGAFCLGASRPDGAIESYVFMNYLGTPRCVMTLAHELGHGVHNRVAGPTQGPLMYQPPLAYAETASVFAEALTLSLLQAEAGSTEAQLSLLMQQIDDTMNTVVRQIGFSNFERRMHDAKGLLSPKDLTGMWLDTLYELYGPPGETFIYNDIERLWAYVPHFYSHFYVYSYACGLLFTHSLMRESGKFGKDFEPMYLDLLRAGGTKDAFELLKPFGLNPADPDFWGQGLKYALELPITQSERLVAQLED